MARANNENYLMTKIFRSTVVKIAYLGVPEAYKIFRSMVVKIAYSGVPEAYKIL